MPTNAPISSTLDVRITFIIRSVPILPEPMIATLIFGAHVACTILAPPLDDSFDLLYRFEPSMNCQRSADSNSHLMRHAVAASE